MSQKRNAGTSYGDIEYETVTCSSCGNEAIKENAERVVRGECKKVQEWAYRDDEEWTFEYGTTNHGWMCEICQNGEPANYPQTDSFWKRLKFAFEVFQ